MKKMWNDLKEAHAAAKEFNKIMKEDNTASKDWKTVANKCMKEAEKRHK